MRSKMMVGAVGAALLLSACAPTAPPMTREAALAAMPDAKAHLEEVIRSGNGAAFCSETGCQRYTEAARTYLRVRGGLKDSDAKLLNETDINAYFGIAVLTNVLRAEDLPPTQGMLVRYTRAKMAGEFKRLNAQGQTKAFKFGDGDIFKAAEGACAEIVDYYALHARAAELENRMEAEIKRNPERGSEIRADYRDRIEGFRRQIDARGTNLAMKLKIEGA